MEKFATVAEYLRATPPPHRAALRKLRATIKAAAPGAVETMGYGMPGFKYQGRTLVYYAAFKNHCSFFGASTALLKKHQKALEPYQTSKGTLQFTADRPLPAPLVTKLVKARIRENQAKATTTRRGRSTRTT